MEIPESLPGASEGLRRAWIFWSPTPDESLTSALDLAAVGPGTRFLDLGCGDGRVLVAAARRGANVRGIELDPAIAETARRRLREAGFSGSVEAGDIFATPLDADVIYAYLTPAMLGQLRPQFAQARPGTRLVTPRYEVVGWEPLAARDGNFLYELPAVRRPAPRVPGWPMRALIVTLRAGRSALLPLTFNAVCGPLELQVEASLADGAKYATTEAPQEEPAPVAMDLVFEPRPAGAVMGGLIRAQGADLTVAAVFTNAQPQKWTFRAGEGVRFQDTLDHVVAEARRGANTTSSASHSG